MGPNFDLEGGHQNPVTGASPHVLGYFTRTVYFSLDRDTLAS